MCLLAADTWELCSQSRVCISVCMGSTQHMARSPHSREATYNMPFSLQNIRAAYSELSAHWPVGCGAEFVRSRSRDENQPVSCCQSETDTDMPLQQLNVKQAFLIHFLLFKLSPRGTFRKAASIMIFIYLLMFQSCGNLLPLHFTGFERKSWE